MPFPESKLRTGSDFINKTMNATSTLGIWDKNISEDVTIRFDTTLSPERITIQKKGENPLHYNFDAITADEVEWAEDKARELYNI